MLLMPFPDDCQSILDVFLCVGIGVGVKNLSLGRNHIGNSVSKGLARQRNFKRRIVGLNNRKAGVSPHRELVAAFLSRELTLNLYLITRNPNDGRAGDFEIFDVLGKFMGLESTNTGE